jgi:predicted metal-dependent enzyme (double-stranded beta helix superfamily)
MDMKTREAERAKAIEAAVADVRAIERAEGVTRASLERIKSRLLQLAARNDLFTLEDYPPPQPGRKTNSCLYRVSEDADHRFALYVNATSGGRGSPVHNHTTWAVIVGIAGAELNRFYERTTEGGVRETGQVMVRQGTGVAFLPEDYHSIHIEAPLINFHMYGLALEQLPGREFYKPAENAWAVFPAHPDIREARPGRA